MDQEQALEIMKMGHNVFLTGAPGSGKTYLLKKYISELTERGIKVAVTAATGIAATHLNGRTIHSWSGIGINDQMTDREIENLTKREYLKQHYRDTEVLILDEVSMLSAKQLDMIDRVAKAFKNNKLPFGGMQVILSGDFFQLPPVASKKQTPKLVSKSHIWKEMDIKICYLNNQFRHKDNKLSKLLSEIRQNDIKQESKELLAKKLNEQKQEDTTKLYTHNKDVDQINRKRLNRISNEAQNFEMDTDGNSKLADKLKQGSLAQEKLQLKKSALVMFVKNNYEKGYVNGTIGEVVGFEDSKNYPVVELESGKTIVATPKEWEIKEKDETKAKIKQIPLRLAWAITVHKSQGMSLDKAEIDLSKSFLPGMGYVALSRLRSMDGLNLLGFNKKALQVREEALKVDQKLRDKSQKITEELEEKEEHEIDEIQYKFLQASSR